MGFDRDEANNIYKKPECQEAYKLLKDLEEKGFTAGESGQNTDEVVRYILTHPEWRLSLQTHKLIHIP